MLLPRVIYNDILNADNQLSHTGFRKISFTEKAQTRQIRNREVNIEHNYAHIRNLCDEECCRTLNCAGDEHVNIDLPKTVSRDSSRVGRREVKFGTLMDRLSSFSF